MNSRLTICIAVALLVAAFLSGCALSPASPALRDEATASPPLSEIGQPEATAPGVDPDREAPMTTSTCAPLAEEETMTPEATPQATEAGLPAGATEAVQLAKDDLARRLDLPPEAIEVVSVEEVDWPDTSLGCPEPGMIYPQVITPGYCVVLGAEGQMYEYHTGGGQLALCGDDGQPHITLWPTVLPGEQDAEFDQEKLMEVERLIREKESLGYDVRTARVYVATAQWMNLQERPAQANAYLDLALEALEEAQEAAKLPSDELRGTVVPRPTFIPEPESREGD